MTRFLNFIGRNHYLVIFFAVFLCCEEPGGLSRESNTNYIKNERINYDQQYEPTNKTTLEFENNSPVTYSTQSFRENNYNTINIIENENNLESNTTMRFSNEPHTFYDEIDDKQQTNYYPYYVTPNDEIIDQTVIEYNEDQQLREISLENYHLKSTSDFKPNHTSSVFGEPNRIGAVCWDGTISSSTGRGTCSHHGGVKNWLYK